MSTPHSETATRAGIMIVPRQGASGMISRERVADSDQPLRSRENLSLHLLAAWAFLAQNARLFVGSPMARVLRSRGDSVAARGATWEGTERQPEREPGGSGHRPSWSL